MSRLARADAFAPDEIAIVHVITRVVRRCFLLGNDPVTKKNFDHRKVWIEDRLQQLAAAFGIDLLAFSCLSNHFHLILRSRPDVVATWDDTDVARRWLLLCPVRKSKDDTPAEPNEFELNSIRHDPERLATIRTRLSDISWWMRLLCQNIAQRANREDGEVGKFFQASEYRTWSIFHSLSHAGSQPSLRRPHSQPGRPESNRAFDRGRQDLGNRCTRSHRDRKRAGDQHS